MDHREIHYRYAIGFLVLLAIAIAALGLYDIPNLVDKMSFALTITSLVLGLVAIIYTFLAGSKQDGQLARLIETNVSISQASTQIRDVATTLAGQVSAIPVRLETLGVKIDSLSKQEFKSPDPVKHADNKPPLTRQDLKEFVANLPYAGMAVLYAFLLAWNSGKVIAENAFNSGKRIPLFFAFGLLSGAHGAGYLEIKYHKGEIIPVSCHKVLTDSLKELLDEIFKLLGEEESATLRSLMKEVEEEFSPTPPLARQS